MGIQRNLGLFNLRLVGNHLKELTFVNLPGADPDPDRGEEDAPEWQAKLDLSWQYGPFLANYGFSYFDETQRYTRQVRTSNPDIADPRYWDYKAREVHDLYFAWEARSGTTIYAGVNNLTDEKPDIGQTFYPVSAVGRFFFLGFDLDLALMR